jgi:hypothetical protein
VGENRGGKRLDHKRHLIYTPILFSCQAVGRRAVTVRALCQFLQGAVSSKKGRHGSGNCCQSVLLDQRQELERRAGRPLLSPFPLAHKIRRHVEVVGKNGLAHAFPLPDRLNLLRPQGPDPRQARQNDASSACQ